MWWLCHSQEAITTNSGKTFIKYGKSEKSQVLIFWHFRFAAFNRQTIVPSNSKIIISAPYKTDSVGKKYQNTKDQHDKHLGIDYFILTVLFYLTVVVLTATFDFPTTLIIDQIVYEDVTDLPKLLFLATKA